MRFSMGMVAQMQPLTVYHICIVKLLLVNIIHINRMKLYVKLSSTQTRNSSKSQRNRSVISTNATCSNTFVTHPLNMTVILMYNVFLFVCLVLFLVHFYVHFIEIDVRYNSFMCIVSSHRTFAGCWLGRRFKSSIGLTESCITNCKSS